MLCQKPVLRQIEWGVQHGPTKKNGVFASNYLIFFENSVSV